MDHLHEVVVKTVEETLNALLDAEADQCLHHTLVSRQMRRQGIAWIWPATQWSDISSRKRPVDDPFPAVGWRAA
jgi:hypothetical protein